MINLNINSDESNINDFLITWNKFESRPNQLIIHSSYIYNSFTELVKINDFNKVSELIPTDDEYIINDRSLGMISDNIFLSYVILENNTENSIITDLTFFYKELEDVEEIYEILDKLETFVIDEMFEDNNSGSLNLLSVDNSNLKIDKLEFNDVNFDKFYSKSTKKSVSSLVKKMIKSKSGLSIFYGEKGTGKTTMIKSISKKLNKDIFFIPNNLIDHTILNPDFLNFLKKYNNSVLVIDDFELIIDNYSRYNSVMNAIIQLVDSLISEVVNVNIILIFNIDGLSEIDDLLECNNLLETVSFDYLEPDEANQLSEYLGNKTKYTNNSKLLSIIRNKNTDYKKRVGF
jgi:DNA replication protein DnaC